METKKPPPALSADETVALLQQAWDLNQQIVNIPANTRASVFIAAAIMASAECCLDAEHPFASIVPERLRRPAKAAAILCEAQAQVKFVTEDIGRSVVSVSGEWDACYGGMS